MTDDFDFWQPVRQVWTFSANYPGVGPALVSGPCIVAIKNATDELLNQCPEAVEWLQEAF
jgi:hypothetical protein